MNRIQTALERIFAQERIVFWYDPDQEWRADLQLLTLTGVATIEVKNNEFGVKHRVMREQPDSKFLIYVPAAKPKDVDNWLLDLVLANYEFHTDRASLILQELGLPYEFKDLVGRHVEFFKSTERQEKLKTLLTANDQDRELLVKMLAVTCRAEPAMEAILFSLFAELADNKTERYEQLTKFGLANFFWRELGQSFGYTAAQPSLMDFVIELFQSNAPLNGQTKLNRESLVLFSRWKDSTKYKASFETLSERIATTLNVSHALNQIEGVQAIQNWDAYRLIDQKIIFELKSGLVTEAVSVQATRDLIARRESTYWFSQYENLYRALLHAANFLDLMRKLDLEINSLEDGVEKYRKTFHRIDLLYRKFIYHQRQAGQANLLGELVDKVEKLYANAFLLPLNDRWQHWVDAASRWQAANVPSQSKFYDVFVQPYLSKGNKVFVIISDALRYEAAVELMDYIAREDRFTAELKAMLGCLPSFTQLGMAALLPNKTLSFAPQSEQVLVDGKSSTGSENRAAILAAKLDGRATALRAKEFLDMPSKTEGRELFKNHDVIYIYHNGIDAVGDKRDTEHGVFDAVETEFDILIKLIKKVAAVNGTNMIITADHGFLYQSQPLDESDFSEVTQTPGMHFYNRRFILGNNLPAIKATRAFKGSDLGLEGNIEVLIPKSIQRLRLQGAGAQYVHGGASLQEVVVPVIEVNKARTSDVEKVEIDLIRSTNQITTGQIAINLYQEQPVSEKCLPRELRVGFFSKSGEPLSDVKTLRFDSGSDDARSREWKERFVFSREADKCNNQDVFLRLEEPVAGTNQFSLYREFEFRMKRAFQSDFDEF